MPAGIDREVVGAPEPVEAAHVGLAVLALELLVPSDLGRDLLIYPDELRRLAFRHRRQPEGHRHDCTDHHHSRSCYAAKLLRRCTDQEACQTRKPFSVSNLSNGRKGDTWRLLL